MTLPLDHRTAPMTARPSRPGARRPGLTALAVVAGLGTGLVTLLLGGMLYAEYVLHVVGVERIVAGDGDTPLRIGGTLYAMSVTFASAAAAARVLRGHVGRPQVWATALIAAAVVGITPAFIGDHPTTDATAYALSVVAMSLGAVLGVRLGAGSPRGRGMSAARSGGRAQ